MSPEQAMEKANIIMAHAWMVRNFIKHAEEVEDDLDMLGVHRAIFDFIRAVEPSYERKDANEYLRRMRNKLSKLKKAAEFFTAEYQNVSSHTNFEMASRSLNGCVEHFEEILAQVQSEKS